MILRKKNNRYFSVTLEVNNKKELTTTVYKQPVMLNGEKKRQVTKFVGLVGLVKAFWNFNDIVKRTDKIGKLRKSLK